MDKSNNDILIITYGRIISEAIKAKKMLEKDGIKCSILKLTKIYPLADDMIGDILDYKHIVFFEESMGSGSISEKIGDKLVEYGYSGDYSRITANGFVKQGSVKDCLSELGLTCEKMVDHIKTRSVNDAKAGQ